MRKLLLISIFCASSVYAGVITRPNTYTAGDKIISADVTANETTLYNEINGNLDSANIEDNSITSDDLAANSVGASEIVSQAVSLDKLTPTGTSGYVLTSSGTSAAPQYTMPTWSTSNKVVQVISAVYYGSHTTTAVDWTSLLSTCTITLSSSTSKVVITYTGNVYYSNLYLGRHDITFARDGSAMGGAKGLGVAYGGSADSNFELKLPMTLTYVDSPGGVGPYTYDVWGKTTGGTMGIGYDNQTAYTITLMEITQ